VPDPVTGLEQTSDEALLLACELKESSTMFPAGQRPGVASPEQGFVVFVLEYVSVPAFVPLNVVLNVKEVPFGLLPPVAVLFRRG
jgi:hypothetical protein